MDWGPGHEAAAVTAVWDLTPRPICDHALTAQIAEDASEAAPATPGAGGAPTAAAASPHFEEAVLHNSADFYKWHSELEATRTSETEEKFRRYAATLQGYLDACNELLGKVGSSSNWMYRMVWCSWCVSSSGMRTAGHCMQTWCEARNLVVCQSELMSALVATGGPDAGVLQRPEVAAPRGCREDAPAARQLPAAGEHCWALSTPCDSTDDAAHLSPVLHTGHVVPLVSCFLTQLAPQLTPRVTPVCTGVGEGPAGRLCGGAALQAGVLRRAGGGGRPLPRLLGAVGRLGQLPAAAVAPR